MAILSASSKTPFWLSIAISVVIGFFAVPALAQNFNQIAPQKPPVPETTGQTGLPTAPLGQPLPSNNVTIVLPDLKGVAFVEGIGKLSQSGFPAVALPATGVSTGGIALLNNSDFVARITPYIGKPVTFERLNQISAVVVQYYREQHRPVVAVNVPEQDVNNGIVQFIVTEFKINQVAVDGNRYFSSDLVREQMDLKPGDVINDVMLTNDLARLNQNAFRHVDAILRRSDQVGDTDLILNVTDRPPFRIYANYNNDGTEVTGLDRWNFGFSWANMIGNLDDQLSYQFSSSDDFWHNRPNDGRLDKPTFFAHAINYSVALPWRDTVTIYGSYAESVPRILTGVDATGVSGQATLHYLHNLPTIENISSAVQLGYDFKTTNNNVEFGGSNISKNFSEIDQFSVSWFGTRPDAYGLTNVFANLYYSPGNLTGANKDRFFLPEINQSGTAGAKANYLYSRLEINRLTYLPRDWVWNLRIEAQKSNRSLLPSEQLAGAGVDSVRGYEEDASLGDEGVLVRNEIRTPSFEFLSRNKFETKDAMQLLLFWDYGSVSPRVLSAAEPRSQQLSALGPGLRYTLGRFLTIEGDVAIRLRRVPTGTEGETANLSLTLAY